MTDILKDIDNRTEHSFQDGRVLENFYGGAGRAELLGRVKSAIDNGTPLLVISGEEGSGKTILCRMIEKDCPASHVTVFFPDTVESFEDVVRIIAAGLGIASSSADEGKGIDATIKRIIDSLVQESLGLLVIFDEAEDIYLATLERVRKMLDRVTAAGARMQILFSGRKAFLENCEQLSICDFRNTEDLHFDVAPLTEQETAEYLRICSERLPNSDKRKVFNDEVVRNIHGLAKGNFKKIQLLADESLRSHGDDTSFMVLLDSVKEAGADDMQPMTKTRVSRTFSSLWWAIGVLCTLLLLWFFLRSGEERPAIKPVAQPAPTSEVSVEKVAPPEIPQQQPIQEVQEEPAPPVAKEPENLPARQEQGEHAPPPEAAPSLPVTLENSGMSEPLDTSVSPQLKEEPTAVVQEISPVEQPVQSPTVKVDSEKIPELRQKPSLKKKVGAPVDSSTKVAKAQVRSEESEPVSGTLTVEQLFQKRLNAAASWERGEKNNKYTVQLMVLTAKNAEQNLKKMLAQSNYRQEAGNFYIFKKNGSTEVVLVFYGEYPTMELARVAQNSLPQFLREHQPYAISVKGALAKVGK